MVQNANVGGYNSRGFVEVLAASQTPSQQKWFQGTADAVRQCLWLFEESTRDGVEDYLILSGTSRPFPAFKRPPFKALQFSHVSVPPDFQIGSLGCMEGETAIANQHPISKTSTIS